MKTCLSKFFVFGIIISSFIFCIGETKAEGVEYDIGINAGDVFFSKSTLIAGQPIRIYAAVRNYGLRDVSGYALFYAGPNLIGESQVVSIRAGGYTDEVFVDWIVPSGVFNVRVDLRGQSPKDENPNNDTALTAFFTPEVDKDGDGITDKNDNCPEVSNSGQEDADKDGIGNACETDDDNDGITDSSEVAAGTNPISNDTDNDGILDNKDNCPLVANAGQGDKDNDGRGDACDSIDNSLPPDQDKDGVSDSRDNCKTIANASQSDKDKDGAGDACDSVDNTPSNEDAEKKEKDETKNEEEKTENNNPQPNNPLSEGETANSAENDGGANNINGTGVVESGGDEDFLQITGSKNLDSLRIDLERFGWNTFVFEPGGGRSGSFYSWNLGDGTIVTGEKIEHKYSKSGTYLVILESKNQDGFVVQKAATTARVGFFSLRNLFFSLPAGTLFGLTILGGLWGVRKLSKYRNLDDFDN